MGEITEVKKIYTRFSDRYSGGKRKLDYEYYYIEATEEEAIKLFEEMFGRYPFNVTCNCCGSDYSVTESNSPDFKEGSVIISRNDINNFLGSK